MVVIKEMSWSQAPGLRRRSQEKWMKLWASNYFYILYQSAWWREHLFGHKVLISQSQHVIDVIISKVPASPAVVCALNHTQFLRFNLHKSICCGVSLDLGMDLIPDISAAFEQHNQTDVLERSLLLWWALAWPFKVLYIFPAYPCR